MPDKKNIFVFGLDPFHLEQAKCVRGAENYEFHGVLDHDEVVQPKKYDIARMIEEADATLRDFGGTVDALISHWDFPASTIQPIVCRRHGLRSASLEAVLKCEHKYWARVMQREAIPDLTPEFAAIDPFADDPLEGIKVPYPFWVKPIKGFSSTLGYRIDKAEDFYEVLPTIRKNIRRLGEPFNEILRHADLPDDIAKVDGNHMIAEQIIKGKQCGLEGYVHEGHVAIHIIVDCVKDTENKSFTRYELPSHWPQRIRDRMLEATKALMAHIGYDSQPFGIEFFWDDETDEIGVLEVNTRISQSHSEQLIMTEGASNHQVAIDLALGRDPAYCRDEGRYKQAAKFLLRRYEDAVVERVPSEDEIQAVEERFPGCKVKISVNEGDRLSDLRDQDSYSYECADIYMGAKDQNTLLENYQEAAHMLGFKFSDGGTFEDVQFEKKRF
ncbi:acetyl-CoA carboxylase biotin carboxylase subunit family protein [Caenispirillum salinarum]|uniref:ATP-grasp domain-containing protein n=1 Tax=Caenispirillum salinarum TaxID=859058 RepID=UPI00384D509A